jgi:hypothetical protein
MSSPDIVLLSTRIISLPHLGQFAGDALDRRYLSLIQEGNFIGDSLNTRLSQYLRVSTGFYAIGRPT